MNTVTPIEAKAKSKPKPLTPLALGQDYLASIQTHEGYWEGEVVWCPMLTAQYVITAYMTGQKIPQDKQNGFVQYFRVWQLDDGSWGMHAESHGYLFVTTLVYIALRLMGYEPEHPMVKQSRAWILERGGPLAIPSWGKLWLAMLNLYDWDAVNPILPELWLLPEWSPVHPRRYYCHTRLIYLAIGVLYGQRFTQPENDLIVALRDELYTSPYEHIDFSAYRNDLHKDDMFAYPTVPVKAAYEVCRLYNRVAPKRLRAKAIEACMQRIIFHVKASRYACISPVNGLLNCLALWIQDPNHPDFLPTFEGVDYWIWSDEEEGQRFNGARSQTWDTSFAVQALAAGPQTQDLNSHYERAFEYYEEHQMQEEIVDRKHWFRDQRVGGFCFSDKHHQWPVSDCTGEALEALRIIREETGRSLSDDRLHDAARFLLSRQNEDGGWGSYEGKRGNFVLENLNPSEMFGNCMIEHSYTECTASCIRGLIAYLNMVPNPPKTLALEIRQSLSAGENLLRKAQCSDGSWAGFWGVNYTYGTLFGVQGLLDCGVSRNDAAIVKALEWIKSAQLPDGGWGETWESCVEERYLPSDKSEVIMTSWALMTLMMAEDFESSVIEPAVNILKRRQLPNGMWPKERVGGVFFNTAMHHYCLYKDYFTVWALGLYESARQSGRL